MAAYVNLVSTRTNTDADFWWTTSDTAAANLRGQILALAEQMNIPYTGVFPGADQLTCVAQFIPDSEEQWQQFTNAINSSIPGLAAARNGYYADHGHTYKLQVRNLENRHLIREVNIFPQ